MRNKWASSSPGSSSAGGTGTSAAQVSSRMALCWFAPSGAVVPASSPTFGGGRYGY
jgi:hypothetical protein